MNFLLNLIWLLFGGLSTAIAYFLSGIVMCITMVGIPWGLQCFKLATIALWPFGAKARKKEDFNGCLYLILTIIWFVVGAIPIILNHLFWGIILCITIIGIPWGRQHFKMMSIALFPFGKEIVIK
ncbi:MAG: YccF domain-containing protein [Bacteroidales bacterium]